MTVRQRVEPDESLLDYQSHHARIDWKPTVSKKWRRVGRSGTTLTRSGRASGGSGRG